MKLRLSLILVRTRLIASLHPIKWGKETKKTGFIPPAHVMGRDGIYAAPTGDKKRFPIFLLLIATILTACDTIIPLDPTEIPTWEYTAPTLAPTEVFYALPPTAPPLNEPVAGQNSDFAASLPAGAELPPLVLEESESGVQTVQLTLRDGQILTGTFYPPTQIEIEGRLLRPRLPAILLLGTSIEWAGFPQLLQSSGYTVLVMDMRSIGLASAVEDILAGLSASDSVYPALMGVMASGENADFALIACANNAICDVLVMFNPRNQDTLLNVVSGFATRPMLVVVNQGDDVSYQTTLALDGATGDNFSVILHDGNANGAEMLIERPALANEVIAWLAGVLVE